jgi:hypothetical protein
MWKRVFGTRSLKNLRTEFDLNPFPLLELPNEIVAKILANVGFAELVILDQFGNPRLCSMCQDYIPKFDKVTHSDIKKLNLRFLQDYRGTGIRKVTFDMEEQDLTEKLEKILSILMRSLEDLTVSRCQFGEFGTDWLRANSPSLKRLHLDKCNIRNLLMRLESSNLSVEEIHFDKCNIAPDSDRYSHWLSLFCVGAVSRSHFRRISVTNDETERDMWDYAAGFFHFVRLNLPRDSKNFLSRLTVWKTDKRMDIEIRPKREAANANFDPEVDVYE